MARKEKIVTVPKFSFSDNRDFGKLFFIREWSAARADAWLKELVFAFNKDGGQIPYDMLAGVGWEALGAIGINTFLRGRGDSATIIRLIDELLECVKIIRDPLHPESPSDLVSEDDVEEVATRYWLRDQVVSVHANFSVLDALWTLLASITTKSPGSSSTQTSARESGT